MRIKFADSSYEIDYHPKYHLALLDTILENDPECKSVELSHEHIDAVKQICAGKFIQYDPTISNSKINKHAIESTWHSLNYLGYDMNLLQDWYHSAIIKPLKEQIADSKSVEAFFIKHFKRISTYHLLKNPNISAAFFEEHILSVLDTVPNCITLSAHMPETFVKKLLNDPTLAKYTKHLNWSYLVQNLNLSETFFNEILSNSTYSSQIIGLPSFINRS